MKSMILDVGMCGFDGPRIKELLKERIGATVVQAATASEAFEQLDKGRFDLILVNRIFAANGDSGLKLIQELKSAGTTTPVMLVSDHEDAQAKAAALGAVPGFGKSELEEHQTFQLIQDALGEQRHPKQE